MSTAIEIKYESFIGVPAYAIDENWQKIKPLIERPLKRTVAGNLYTSEDIKEAIKSRDMQLWASISDGIEIAVVTEIIQYPKTKVFGVVLVGGRNLKHHLEEGYETLKAYARAQGCEYLRGFGRKGWTRVLEEKPEYHVLWDVKL